MESSLNGHTPSSHHSQVLLVTMPFGPLLQPAIGLSLLKEVLRRALISTEILYLTLKFAEIIGSRTYNKISVGEPYVDLAGEWIFSKYLFGEDHPRHADYIDDVLRRQSPDNSRQAVVSENYIDLLLYVDKYIESFLDQAVDMVLAKAPKVVGFTSTFQQHVASLCLAKRIKARNPDIFIMMGGGNCEGLMGVETIRQFPFVDAVVSGEGENILPQLVDCVLNKKNIDILQGVFTQNNIDFVNVNGKTLGAPPVYQMDELPIPTYDDFFAQVQLSSMKPDNKFHILFETSRGCWWGERNHCTFCGLNGATMSYRSKSGERALSELLHLVEKYPNNAVLVVDNILDMNYFNNFIPQLGALNLDLDLFYEVKANLRKEQLMAMRDAGIRNLQPGIESLNNHVLQLMKKGVSWLQNVQLLKWGKELDVAIHWNMLWGFPDETAEDYAQMEAIFPYLHHLKPPSGSAKMRLDRFSPHFNDVEEYDFTNVRPAVPYPYIYPFEDNALTNLAYHFFYDYTDNRDIRTYTEPLYQRIKGWRVAYETSELFLVDLDTHLLIWDLREELPPQLTILDGIQRFLYLECDKLSNVRQLKKLVEEEFGVVDADIEALLSPLTERHLILYDAKLYLSLATRLGDYTVASAVLPKLKKLVEESEIRLDHTTMLDPMIYSYLDDNFFDLDENGQPIVYYKALCGLIDYNFISSFIETSQEVIAGIQIDI